MDLRLRHSSEAFVATSADLETVASCARAVSPDNGRHAGWFANYVETQKRRIAFDLSLVRERCDGNAAIVEFGAVPLLLTAPLARLGYRVTGVDIAPERFGHAIEALRLDVVRADIETERLSFPDGRFDVALFNELFEHLRINPIATMREVHRILRPGGRLFLSTPNLRSLAGLANFLLKNRCYSCGARPYDEYEKLETVGHMGHVREYTTREMTEFLTRIGFEIEEIVHRGTFDIGWADTLCRALPGLRPFATYVARKSPAAD